MSLEIPAFIISFLTCFLNSASLTLYLKAFLPLMKTVGISPTYLRTRSSLRSMSTSFIRNGTSRLTLPTIFRASAHMAQPLCLHREQSLRAYTSTIGLVIRNALRGLSAETRHQAVQICTNDTKRVRKYQESCCDEEKTRDYRHSPHVLL